MTDSTSHSETVNVALRAQAFFELSRFAHRALFEREVTYVWEALQQLPGYIEHWLASHPARLVGDVSPGAYLVNAEQIYLGEGSVIEAGAYVAGPAIIGPNCTIRHGAYLRGHVLMGDEAIIGHASEAKNTILLNQAQAPHFAYIGDSILGRKVNLGAGTKLSNLTIVSRKNPATGKRPTVRIMIGGTIYDTGLAKLGAILGDGVQTGCNSVLNPGCLVGPQTLIYPNVSLPKGYYEGHQVIKLRQNLEFDSRSMKA
jgi:NDP-sugar pyrophosphorylase family protein